LYYNLHVALSVRLDEETRKLLERLARAQRLSRSEVVRRGIHMLAENELATVESDPYGTIHHLIGKVRGGQGDLSEKRNRTR
jgi:hypothetical protein